MKKANRKLFATKLIFITIVIFSVISAVVLGIYASSTPIERMEKNVKSGDAKAVSKAVGDLTQILEASNVTYDSISKDVKQQGALRILIENMKDVPQCEDAILKIFKENKHEIFDYAASHYLKASYLDDKTFDAFMKLNMKYNHGQDSASFELILSKIPVPDIYKEIAGTGGAVKKHGDKELGKIVVIRKDLDTTWYLLDSLTFELPDAHQPSFSGLANADTVIQKHYEKIAVGEYTNGAKAYRKDTILDIYDVKTQERIFSTTLEGGKPPLKIISSDDNYGIGDAVGDNEIINLLTTMHFTV